MAAAKGLHPVFRHRQYLFRRMVFNVWGGAFKVQDGNGNLVFSAKQEITKLRTELRVYLDGIQKEEFLTIKTPNIADIGATYNVHDTSADTAVGAVKRRALKSFVRDEWVFLSDEGAEIGRLTESSMPGAILGRIISFIPIIGDIIPIPKRFAILSADGREVAQIRRHVNPLVIKHSLTIIELEPSIDPRLLIAAGIIITGL